MLLITGGFKASQATQARHLRWGVFASQRPVSLGGKKDAVRCEELSSDNIKREIALARCLLRSLNFDSKRSENSKTWEKMKRKTDIPPQWSIMQS
ncbi:hypothetical protein, partial [Mesotoga prima]|uniref:hypothetical protein n=1 Tax=Mesotoga prima TaxID=1184387 RepID=UPI002C13FD76